MDTLGGVDDVGHADLAGNGVHGTVPGALAAALAQLGDDLQMALAAIADGTVVVHHMGQILVPEVAQGALHRLAGALAQAAQSRLGNGVGQILQQLQVLHGALVADDAVQDLQHALGALPAGDAFAAALVLVEAHEEAGSLHHAGVLVHDHQATKLVSDYSKKDPSSRSKTMNTVVDGYKSASEKISTVFADGANSYVLPYVTNVSNVPVYSSGFNVTDFDIPFYQMVIHGYVDYASTPINKSSNSDETFLLSLASGSQIHYDMTYADADTLQDTEYDDLYYSNYAGWTDLAANQYKKVSSILSGVSDYTITKYELSDDKNVLTTTYSTEML